jgi:ubiquinone/menaquinone biosynthesis C-methylase UbiE
MKNLRREIFMDQGNYAKHARIWDWGGYDDTAEFDYWCQYAEPYGNRVLSPLCALGQTGAYMAERGFTVIAYDFTQEMVEEGRKRFGNTKNFQLLQGDIRSFSFDIEPVDFVFIKDLGHLHSLEDVKAAFARLNHHMRQGAALVLETGLPPKESIFFPETEFYPLRQVYPGLKVWKTGSTRHDREKGQTRYDQTVYIQDETGTVESFRHALTMQWYEREALLAALHACGFAVRHEYQNRTGVIWTPGCGQWIAEAVKVTNLSG